MQYVTAFSNILVMSIQSFTHLSFPFSSSHQDTPILTASLQSRLSQKMRKIMAKKMTHNRRSKDTRAVPVGSPTRTASSGSVVIFARSGSMANVSGSPLQRRSTSSTTSALPAATRGAGNDHGRGLPLELLGPVKRQRCRCEPVTGRCARLLY